jgi:hypothetical protein
MTARRAVAWTALCAGLAAGPAAPPARAAESVEEVQRLATRYAEILRSSLPVLQRSPDAATIWAALYDARRAVAEVDRLAASASIFGAAVRDRLLLQDLSAEAHLRLALFETHGLEFDRARQEIVRARTISDHVESPDYRIEWAALASGEPGQAMVTRYHLLTLPEFEAALGSIWSRARPVPFEMSGYSTDELSVADLSRTPPATPGSLDDRLLSRGLTLLREALDQGKREFTVPLPPGVYRLQARAGSEIDRPFAVPEVDDVDPVVLERARFALRVEPRPGPRGPRFFLNGIEIQDLTSMAYGVYRVKVDPGFLKGTPEVVRFVMGEGIADKTRTSWTIYVPAGESAVFQVDRPPLGERIFRP